MKCANGYESCGVTRGATVGLGSGSGELSRVSAFLPLRIQWLASIAAVMVASCGQMPRQEVRTPATGTMSGPSVTVFVIRRSWHTDIGFEVADLRPPLASLDSGLPGARFLLFGFGDKRYLMTHAAGVKRLLGAVWPGEGLVLLTGLKVTPETAFGANSVVRLTVTDSQAQALEEFVWRSLATDKGEATLLAPGPYEGSAYYASSVRYSGLHTCNTWTAEGLHAAGLPIHSFGVEFASQVWGQVKTLTPQSFQQREPDAR